MPPSRPEPPIAGSRPSRSPLKESIELALAAAAALALLVAVGYVPGARRRAVTT
jgi:hypothetical protein